MRKKAFNEKKFQKKFFLINIAFIKKMKKAFLEKAFLVKAQKKFFL